MIRSIALALAVLSSVGALVACTAQASDEVGDSDSAQRRSAGARTFTLDAPWSCSVQEMATLGFTPTSSRGHVKITMKFAGDPAVPTQVAAIVASRPTDQYRKMGKVKAGRVTVDVKRDSIDGQARPLAASLAIADLEGGVNADKAGPEAPYRLRYEINESSPGAAASNAFGEDFWFTLYNIGNAGKSFTLAANAMQELNDGAQRLYCTAKATFADPQTGELPKGPQPIILDAGPEEEDPLPDAAAWPFPTP